MFRQFLGFFTIYNILLSIPLNLQPLTTRVGISLLDCYKECNKRGSCRSIIYNRRALFCLVYDQPRVMEGSILLREPGLVYKDIGDTPQLVVVKECFGTTCSAGKSCGENGCSMTECPRPPSYPGMTIQGNMRFIYSRIAYLCDNYFKQVYSMCNETGMWSDINTLCITYSYEYAGQNTSASTTNALFVLQNDYLEVCLKKCNETSGCLGVNYLITNKTCTSTHVGATRWTPVENSNYYYRGKYPVTLYAKNGLKYRFTLEEGVKFCESLDTTIASASDLDLAYELGYGFCSCGWIDVGISKLVLQVRCNNFPPGINPCWDAKRFDVFCKNINFRI